MKKYPDQLKAQALWENPTKKAVYVIYIISLVSYPLFYCFQSNLYFNESVDACFDKNFLGRDANLPINFFVYSSIISLISFLLLFVINLKIVNDQKLFLLVYKPKKFINQRKFSNLIFEDLVIIIGLLIFWVGALTGRFTTVISSG